MFKILHTCSAGKSHFIRTFVCVSVSDVCVLIDAGVIVPVCEYFEECLAFVRVRSQELCVYAIPHVLLFGHPGPSP